MQSLRPPARPANLRYDIYHTYRPGNLSKVAFLVAGALIVLLVVSVTLKTRRVPGER